MARIVIWRGDREMAERIEQVIRKWDPKEEVAKRLSVEPVRNTEESALFGTFATKGDGQDAAAFADGYAAGFSDGIIAADPHDEEDEDDTDPDLDEEEDDPDLDDEEGDDNSDD